MHLILQNSPRAVTRAIYVGTLILTTWLQATEATAGSDTLVPDATELQASSADSQQLYEPEFSLFSRDVVGRAPVDDQLKLENNARKASNLRSGDTICYKVEKSVLFGTAPPQTRNELRAVAPQTEDSVDSQLLRRQDISKTLYVSANTCRQPRRASSNNKDTAPPQLILCVSTNDDECRNPTQDTQGVQSIMFEEGAAMLIADASSDVYVCVTAPKATAEFEDVYNFEVAVSIDDYYHRFDNTSESELLWVDSDSKSVRLKTNDLTKDKDEVEKIMAQPLPYELFAHNSGSDSINGLRHSVCGLMNEAQIFAKRDGKGKQQGLVKMSMAVRGERAMPKQEFFFDGLNVSSSYVGILVKLPQSASVSGRQESSGTVGGGGIVFQPLQFNTTSESNCDLVSNFEFCNEIDYAVPGNGNKLNTTALGKVYDDFAKSTYEQFETVMMQIPCDTDSTSQYSLARNCQDCRNAYKRWLCTASIPRCLPFNSSDPFAIERNVGQPFPDGSQLPKSVKESFERIPGNNASRNSFIDTEIEPGPYLELLPCEDVCYEVVRSCPASIGFTCPQPKMTGFNVSYAQRDEDPSVMSCNFPGEARTGRASAAGTVLPQMSLVAAAALVGPLFLVLV